MADFDVDALVAKLQSISRNPPLDTAQRRRLHDAAQALTQELEAPQGRANRLIYAPAMVTNAEIAGNMQMFETLLERHASGSMSSIADLASPRGADHVLTARIARGLAAHQLIDQVDDDAFAPNAMTKVLNTPMSKAGVKHFVHTVMASYAALPDFLERTDYQNPNDNIHCLFQLAYNTDLPRFVWMQEHPDLLANFGVLMAGTWGRDHSWLDVLDSRALVQSAHPSPDKVLFVDVGGGIGQQCALLKQRLPDLPGKVVLQEVEKNVMNMLPTPGVQGMVFDFWKEQPIKGALMYYMRMIMHDYPDEKCRLLLRNTRAAMSETSVILIDEVIVPAKGAHENSTDMDITMMCSHAGMERTEAQWQDLFASVGLKRLDVQTFDFDYARCVQVLAKADSVQ